MTTLCGRRSVVALGAAALVMSAAVAGCGEPAAAAAVGTPPGTCAVPQGPVAVAAGARANSPAPIVTPRLASVIMAAVISGPSGAPGPALTLVRLDGRSDQTTTGRFVSEAGNPDALHDDQARFLDTFGRAMAGDRAVMSEANDLTALWTASRAARDPAYTSGSVVLMDSGLSTVAPLDFSEKGMLDADVDETVEFLASHGAIPDLRGLVVVFIGLGDVAFPSPQDPLDPARQRHIVELYTKIAQKGGAACVEVVAEPHSGPAADGVPSVRAVPVPLVVSIPASDPPPTVLPDDPVTGFVPDEATLLAPDGARGVLWPLATWLMADPRRSVKLSGTTARIGSLDGQRDLGGQRADTIKQVLVHMGVTPTQVTTEGLGSEFPQYVVDHDTHGLLLPGPAHDNRGVRVLPQTES